MSKKNKNQVTSTTTEAPLLDIIIKQEDLDMNPELVEAGVEAGDLIQVDAEDSYLAASEEYTDLMHFYLTNEVDLIPVDYLLNVQGNNFSEIDVKPFKFSEHLKGRVDYCSLNLQDFVEHANDKGNFICIPSKYDVVKEEGLWVAYFSKEGKLNFKDCFDIQVRSLKRGL